MGPDITRLRSRLDDNKAGVQQTLRADPFDKAAYLAQAEKKDQTNIEINKLVEQIVLTAAGQMTLAGRQVIGAHLRDLSWDIRHPPARP